MKKFLLMALSMVTVAALAITGTVAWLTWEDSDVNVMTTGNVNAELHELQRNDDHTALEPFEQGKVAMPYVDGTTKDSTFNLIAEDNHIDKIVYATNTGDSDAFMRILVAIPAWANTTDNQDNANANNLHWNYPGDTTSDKIQTWLEENENVVFDEDADQYSEYDFERVARDVLIEGKKYTVWSFTFKNAIDAGKSTNIVLTGLYLDKRMDYDANTGKYLDINGKPIDDFDGTIYVPVLLQAVQVDGFKDAKTALNTAFGGTEKVAEWFNGIEIPTVVDDEKGLTDALKNGNDVVLADDITVTDPIRVDGDAKVNIDLAGHAINYTKTTDRPIAADGSADVTIKNGTVNSNAYAMAVFGDGKIYAENVVFNSKYGFGMNGSTTTENSVAEFVNCEFHITSAYNAAYISAKGTYTFKDCVLEGGAGVLIRSGNVVLDGCTVIANGYMGKGGEQALLYTNYPVTASEVLNDGVAYWSKSTQEGSVGDCVAILDNCGSGHDLKSVTIKNCKFDVVNTVTVDGAEVATGYAVRYLNMDGQADKATVVLENNTDLNGNAIQTGTLGLVYSEYTR